jgi:hypothetical protein
MGLTDDVAFGVVAGTEPDVPVPMDSFPVPPPPLQAEHISIDRIAKVSIVLFVNRAYSWLSVILWFSTKMKWG